jgi:hypothetical protein
MATFFADCMHGVSIPAMITIPKLKLWSNYKTFIDIGGSKGVVVASVLKAQPHLKGINAELQELKEQSEAYIKEQGLQDRMQFHELDFFK